MFGWTLHPQERVENTHAIPRHRISPDSSRDPWDEQQCHLRRAGREICWLRGQTSGQTLPRCQSGGVAGRLRCAHDPLWSPPRAGRAAATNEEEPGRGLVKKLTPKTATEVEKAHPQVPQGGSGKTARSVLRRGRSPDNRGHLERFQKWADDEGRELREDEAVDSALVEFLNDRFLLGLQALELRKVIFFFGHSIWLHSLYLVSWIGPMLRSHTGGHQDGHLFEFNCTDFLEQVSISRERSRPDNLVPCQMRHWGVSIDVNKISEASRWLRKAEGGGNIFPWRVTRNTQDCQKLHATTSWTPSAIAPRSISAHRSDGGSVRGPLVFWLERYGTCMSTHGFCSPFLGVGQVPGKPGRHPSLPADVCFKWWQLGTFCVSLFGVSTILPSSQE